MTHSEMKYILKLLNEWDVKNRWLGKRVEAAFDPENETIFLNVWVIVVTAFLHEWEHYKDPRNTDEKEIICRAAKKVAEMSIKDIKLLAEVLLERLSGC